MIDGEYQQNCIECGAIMERNQKADKTLPRSGLVVKGYICPNCGFTDEIAAMFVKNMTLQDFEQFMEKTTKGMESKGDVIFSKEENMNDKAIWTIHENPTRHRRN